MASCLIVIILCYFFFSLSLLGDKLVLSGAPKPKLYTFYAGALGGLVIFLIPFAKNFTFPIGLVWVWIVLEAIVYLAGLYSMFKALEKFEVSRVMTTIGAMQPIFILFLTWIFWGFSVITQIEILAFCLLLLGSVLISYEKKSTKSNGYFKIAIFASLFFSLDYIFQKFIFLHQPFLQGFIWMRIFSFCFMMIFLFSKNLRKDVFAKKENIIHNKKIGLIFICSQASGGIANVLQGFAIALAPVAFLPIINSLRGVQYIFLFLITLFLSLSFPKILKEETKKGIIIQKIISIIIIAVGLALVANY